jgi:hypothetical protein
MGYLIGLAVIALTIAAIRWVRGRRHLDLTSALDAPWWLWPLMRFAIHWYWKRETHQDLYGLCGWVDENGNPSRGPWRYISIRQGDDGRFRVKIQVKRGFPQGDDDEDARMSRKMQVVNHAKGTMDLGPVDFEWHWRLIRSHVVITPRKVVPKVALGMAPDIAALVAENLTADRVVPAIGKGDQAITHSTTDDASHVLLSGTTMGGGKSETLKTFGIQSYAPSILSGRDIPGADLLIIDTTRKFSHADWAIDYDTGEPWPGIIVATELDQAAYYLTLAAQAMEQRGEITRQAKIRGDNVEWSRLLIMCDDSNGFMKQLREHKHDEALVANSMLLWHARGVNMYKVDAFQRGSAIAAGGGDNREAYGGRIWADGSDKTGDMLADAVDRQSRPKPKPHAVQPGHAVFIYGSLAYEGQRIYYTDAQAHDICRREANRRRIVGSLDAGWLGELETGGEGGNYPKGRGYGPESQTHPNASIRPPRPPQAPVSGVSPSPTPDLSIQAIDAISHIDDTDGEVNYLRLRDLAACDWCPYTYHTIRTMAKNENGEEFPDPIEGFSNPRRWSERAVREWVEDYQSGDGKSWGVYFAWKPGDATLKIGFTGNLRARRKKWNWHEDWIRRWIPCASRKDAMALENTMHRRYGRYHEELEWFRVEGTLARDLGLSEEVTA